MNESSSPSVCAEGLFRDELSELENQHPRRSHLLLNVAMPSVDRFPLLLLVLLTITGCSKSDQPKAAKSEKPSKVEAHPSEVDIYRIVLTAKGVERLQISTVPAEIRSVPRTRSLGGDLMIPDGQRIPVTAPLTGTLLRAGDAELPVAGQRVAFNQPLLSLTPMLPPEREVPNAAERVAMANAKATLVSSQIQAEGDMQQAKAQVEAAKIAVARATRLLQDRAGSRRQVDEAEAALNIATQALKAASERKTLLDELSLDAKTGKVSVLPITSPHAGIIQIVNAQVGQVVNAGAPLFEIVDMHKMWVRVPVYAGLVDEIDFTADASARGLSSLTESVPAKPIAAPPTANALSASVDLYFEVDNSDSRFRPGERVTVELPLKGESESLVVPRAAVLRDIYGTGWVYVQSGETEFRRERVSVDFTTETLAVLSLGPDVGTPVVVDGAAELFGTEFGAGK